MEYLTQLSGSNGVGVLLMIGGILSLIQISPLKINPWGWVAKQLRLWLLGDLPEKVDRLIRDYAEFRDVVPKKLDVLIKDYTEFRVSVEQRQAADARSKIAIFSDEIYRGELHSKESFEQILEYVNFYLDYCDKHKGFRNNITDTSITVIQDTYKACLSSRKFI